MIMLASMLMSVIMIMLASTLMLVFMLMIMLASMLVLVFMLMIMLVLVFMIVIAAWFDYLKSLNHLNSHGIHLNTYVYMFIYEYYNPSLDLCK